MDDGVALVREATDEVGVAQVADDRLPAGVADRLRLLVGADDRRDLVPVGDESAED